MTTATEKRPLTERQADIYRFIVRYWGEHMRPPAIRDICDEFGISSPNGIVCHLTALERKGLIERPESGAGKKVTTRGIVVPALTAAVQRAAAELLAGMS